MFIMKLSIPKTLFLFLNILQSFCKSESPSNIQKLKNDKGLVNGIIQNLPEHYADQVRKRLLSTAFRCYPTSTYISQVKSIKVHSIHSVGGGAGGDDEGTGKKRPVRKFMA